MHDVACEIARAAVRSKDAQKQLALTSLKWGLGQEMLGDISYDKGTPKSEDK